MPSSKSWSAGVPPLAPLRALRSLLSRPLQWQRRGFQIHLLLGQAAPAVSAAPTAARHLGPGARLRAEHDRLRALLDRHPDARNTLRHLAFLEAELGRRGSRTFTGLPDRVLRRSDAQLRALLRDDPTLEFPELEQRLAAALAALDRDALPGAGRVDVSEASHSLFDEMERSWHGQAPVGG